MPYIKISLFACDELGDLINNDKQIICKTLEKDKMGNYLLEYQINGGTQKKWVQKELVSETPFEMPFN